MFLCAFQIEKNDLINQQFLSPKLGANDDKVLKYGPVSLWTANYILE
jgi:hypothetical protein